MKIVNLSKNQFLRLSPLPLEKGICNSEGDIIELNKKSKSYILKKFHDIEGTVFANKLYTLEMLDTYRDFIPNEFTLPISLLSVQGKLSGFVMPKIQGINLQSILNDTTIDSKENIYYFKFRNLKFRLKKRANLYDVWYQNDRIYVVLFMKIKFNFKFEYSKLERK